jgi:hypothetical protein
MLKILIITRDAAESLDVMYPYQRLKGEGYDGTSSPTTRIFNARPELSRRPLVGNGPWNSVPRGKPIVPVRPARSELETFAVRTFFCHLSLLK